MYELQKWIEQHSQRELAEKLGITQGAVSQWLINGRVPVKRARDVERATGIPVELLCPEFFGDSAA